MFLLNRKRRLRFANAAFEQLAGQSLEDEPIIRQSGRTNNKTILKHGQQFDSCEPRQLVRNVNVTMKQTFEEKPSTRLCGRF